jgi:FtsX-like permease family protein
MRKLKIIEHISLDGVIQHSADDGGFPGFCQRHRAVQSRPSCQPADILRAELLTKGAYNGLFLALGAIALLVGGVGIANVMVISVLERRSEIGLRRALGATRRHIAEQFLAEAVLLAVLGGLAQFVAKLLLAERRRRGTPRGSRALTCFWQAVMGLRWFGDRTSPEALAQDAMLRSLRCLGERGFALLTPRWRALQHITASPSRIGDIARAALVLTNFEYGYLT